MSSWNFPIDTLRDSAGSGTFDRLDPGRAFRIRSLNPGGSANELVGSRHPRTFLPSSLVG